MSHSLSQESRRRTARAGSIDLERYASSETSATGHRSRDPRRGSVKPPSYFSAATQDISEVADNTEPIPSTFQALQRFASIVAWKEFTKGSRQEKKRLEISAKSTQQVLVDVHRRLVSGNVRTKNPSHANGGNAVPYAEKYPTNTSYPDTKELLDLATYYYPPACTIKATVVDFGLGFTRRHSPPIGEIESWWQTKPDDVTVRWIHLPINNGVLKSSLEDLFLHCGETASRPFKDSSFTGFPFLQIEYMDLQSVDEFQRKRDTYLLLRNNREVTQSLEASSKQADRNEFLQEDMDWRANHLGTSLTHWELMQNQLPLHLSERGCLSEIRQSMYYWVNMGALGGVHPLKQQSEPRQVLTQHRFFSRVQLKRNELFAYHRNDGFLLTNAAMDGANYVDKDLDYYLSLTPESRSIHPEVSCIERCIQRFEKTGTLNWHRRNLDWLMIYLATEFASTPNNFNGGLNAPSLSEAYQAISSDLNRRRYESTQRQETVKLIRDYLSCIDELHNIITVYSARCKLFANLVTECALMEQELEKQNDPADNSDAESAVERAKLTLKVSQEDLACFTKLREELRQSLNALFQLRTIEQDELARLSARQNRAVVLFTSVTIVFLPLSFFTSYFGMNLVGIAGTKHTEGYFWAVCGTVAIILCGALLIWAVVQYGGFVRPFKKKRTS